MRHLFLSFASLSFLALVISSCGGGKKENKEEGGTEKETTTKTDTKRSIGSGGSSSGCKSNSVSFSSDNMSLAAADVKYVGAESWNMYSGEKVYPSVVIQVANYEKTGDYMPMPSEEGQVRAIISINGKIGEQITAGTYDMAAAGFGESNSVSAGLESSAGSKGFSSGTGTITVTYASADKICGTIDVKDSKGTVIKGDFSCPVIPKEQ